MTPMTIPAIAPGLRPLLLDAVMVGKALPLAVAAGRNVWVVVTETVPVDVETPPLVGRNGAE